MDDEVVNVLAVSTILWLFCELKCGVDDGIDKLLGKLFNEEIVDDVAANDDDNDDEDDDDDEITNCGGSCL